MKITRDQILNLYEKPCEEGLAFYDKTFHNVTDDLLTILIETNKYNSSWSRWLFTRLMNKNQNIQIAIFSAELVLDVFEKSYPDDSRPRFAIEAAKEYLKNPSDAARAAADAAACAAYATACAAYAADAAACAAAYAADATACADIKAIQEIIINEAVRILENEN